MLTTLITSLQNWNLAYDARQKLQHAYLIAIAGLILGAGIIGLINYDLGQRILLGAFICIAVFIFNAVAWALLQSFVLLRIPEQTKPVQKPTTRKK